MTVEITERTDEEILALRTKLGESLSLPTLRSMRKKLHELYNNWCDAERKAANYARHMGGAANFEPSYEKAREAASFGSAADVEYQRAERRGDRAMKMISEAEGDAAYARRIWLKADHAYAVARAEALREAGLLDEEGQDIRIGQTSTEKASELALRRRRLDLPPVGWGRSSPTFAERIARWQARPERERLSDPRIREEPVEQ
jgi:hypothetical protein